MNKEQQIEEMAKFMHYKAHGKDKDCDNEKCEMCWCSCKHDAESLYTAGYRKTFTSDLASDTQKAFKEGYEKARKETAKEIFQKVVNICRKEEDFQDGTVNTQLEPLYFGIMNGCAFIRGEVKELAEQYGVEVEE